MWVVIYNHNLRELEGRWQREANGLLVKMQDTLRSGARTQGPTPVERIVCPDAAT